MPVNINIIRYLVIILGFMTATPAFTWAAGTSVIAINIALEPDAAMTDFAKTVNAEMLKSYPQGFTLDDTHVPHITLLQRYVRTENLNAVFAAVDKTLATALVSSWRLKASNYSFNPWADGFLGSIVMEQNGGLLKLQQKLLEAIAPYAEKNGSAGSFFKTHKEPEISRVTIDYVTTFVPERVGKNYWPHLTLGLASAKQRDTMIKEVFPAFAFSPAAVVIYQIGNYGTARKKLKEWRW